jgi:hypothetical protein
MLLTAKTATLMLCALFLIGGAAAPRSAASASAAFAVRPFGKCLPVETEHIAITVVDGREFRDVLHAPGSGPHEWQWSYADVAALAPGIAVQGPLSGWGGETETISGDPVNPFPGDNEPVIGPDRPTGPWINQLDVIASTGTTPPTPGCEVYSAFIDITVTQAAATLCCCSKDMPGVGAYAAVPVEK